jgi:hypothetical protein
MEKRIVTVDLLVYVTEKIHKQVSIRLGIFGAAKERQLIYRKTERM